MSENNPITVKPLHTIHLEVRAGSQPGIQDLTSRPLAFEFIFGLGVQGLTPFERLLEGLPVGSQTSIKVKHESIPTTFLNLKHYFMELCKKKDPLFLTVRVVDVHPAESREVIRAMARQAECGDGCCCGGH